MVRAEGALEDVDRLACEAILHLLALGHGPVLCDLTRVDGAISAGPAVLLAAPTRHTRDWPGSLIAFACPTGEFRSQLARQVGAHVVLTHGATEAMARLQHQPR